MARGFGATYGSGATDQIKSQRASGYPSTSSVHIWTYRNGAGGGNFGRLFQCDTNGGTGGLFVYNNGAGASTLAIQAGFSTTAGLWNTTSTLGASWKSFGMTYDGSSTSNNPTAYIDGTKETVGSGLTRATGPSGTYGTGDNPLIGNRGSDDARAWDGMLAEFALWGAALDDAEFAALHNGVSPLDIRPGSLLEYIPLVRANHSYKIAAPTITGTAVQPHPRIIMPRRTTRARRFDTAVAHSVSPATVDLALSETAPSAVEEIPVSPARVDLAISPTAPAAVVTAPGFTISPAQANLVFTGVAPVAETEKTLDRVDLALSTTAPTATVAVVNVQIGPARVDLALSSTAPTLTIAAPSFSVSPARIDLAISTTVPTINAGNVVNISPTSANLVISTVQPTVDDDKTLDSVNLTLSTTAPNVTIQVGSGFNISVDAVDLALSSTAPTVAADTAGSSIVPTRVDLVISGVSPVAETEKALNTVELVLTTSVPTVTGGGTGVQRIVDAVDLTLSRTAPSVILEIPVSPPRADLVLSSTVPGADVTPGLSPTTAQLVLSTTAPESLVNVIIDVTGIDLVLSASAPIMLRSDVTTRAVGIPRRLSRSELDQSFGTKRRFSRKYYEELRAAQKAAVAAEKKALRLKSEQSRKALEFAAEMADQAIREAAHQDRQSDLLDDLTRMLRAATAANEASEATARAVQAARQAATMLAEFERHRQQMLDEDEDEVMALLLA